MLDQWLPSLGFPPWALGHEGEMKRCSLFRGLTCSLLPVPHGIFPSHSFIPAVSSNRLLISRLF